MQAGIVSKKLSFRDVFTSRELLFLCLIFWVLIQREKLIHSARCSTLTTLDQESTGQAPKAELKLTKPTEYPNIKSTNIVLYVVGFGTLLTAMAASAVNLALPSLSEDLGIAIDLASWILLSFLLCSAVRQCLLDKSVRWSVHVVY